MADESSKTCVECQGSMSPVVIMDQDHHRNTWSGPQSLRYRLPDDRRSFWTGTYPTAGQVRAFMCCGCGRIALYGSATDSQQKGAPELA